MKYLLTVILSALSLFSFGQTADSYKLSFESAGLNYNRPKDFRDFIPQYSKKFFFYSTKKYIYPFAYEIVNKDSSLCIGFSVYELNLKNDSDEVLQKLYPGRKANVDYKLPIKHKADTLNHKVNYYSSKKSRKLFHATIAGDYYMNNFETSYEKRYNRCRVIFMHKENIGDAEIYYFYSTGDEKKVNNLIKKASSMMHFK